jgi:hypothetical protein
MQIELNLLLEVTFVALLVKLVVGQWTPPIQKSAQAIMVCAIGSLTGVFLNTSKEGIIVGLVASAFAFYGKELTDAFLTTYGEMKKVKVWDDKD